jgi:hypothetical protein
MASIIVSNIRESWTLAAVCLIASGTPRRSTTRWRFEPDLPRSVGLGPVCWPPRGLEHFPSLVKLGTHRCGQRSLTDRAARDGGHSTRQRPASPVSGAHRSSRCHRPSPGEALPMAYRCCARRAYPSMRHGCRGMDVRPSAEAVLVGTVARSRPIVYRRPVVLPYAHQTTGRGFVRRSKRMLWLAFFVFRAFRYAMLPSVGLLGCKGRCSNGTVAAREKLLL